jgi:hypothetical protein
MKKYDTLIATRRLPEERKPKRENTAGGFVGSIYGMYAAFLGMPSAKAAAFD